MTNSAKCPFTNLLDPTLIANGVPEKTFAAVREAGPAVKIEDPITGVPYWAVTQKEGIDFVSMHNELFSSALRAATPMEDPQETVDNIMGKMFLNMDPPLNLEYRKLIRDNFLPGTVATYQEKAERVAKEVIDALIDRGECEFVEDVAAELPLITILEFFNIPTDQRKQFFDWTNDMFFQDDPAFSDADRQGAESRALDASANVFMTFMGLATEWRGRPEKNLCTQLLNGEIRGEPVSDEDFAWIALMLMSAGNESTRTAITHGMRNLMENPEQYRFLQEHPEALDDAVEEMLRKNTSFITMRRTATQDVCAPELGNADIKKGDKVVMFYHASNNDPRLFGEDATQFDLTRPKRQSDFKANVRSFGIGKHNCLGMHLAKLEMKVQLAEILKRMDNPQFSGPVTYIHSYFVQGIRSMPITFTKRGE